MTFGVTLRYQFVYMAFCENQNDLAKILPKDEISYISC